MELRRVSPSELDLTLGRLRQLPEAAVRSKEASFRTKGQLSPLVAAERDGVLMLIDGFVRHLAAVRLGLPSLLVEVVELSEVQMKAQLYLRNRERGLQLFEECQLVRELCEVDGLSQVEVSELLERHKSWVCRRLSLIRQVSRHLVEDLSLGLLSQGALRKLALLPARNQEELWAAARSNSLSQRDTAALVELFRRAPDPQARRYVLEQPEEALRCSRATPEAALDPRLGPAGRELAKELRVLRQLSVRLGLRLSPGELSLSPEGLSLLTEAKERAEQDFGAAMSRVTALLSKAERASDESTEGAKQKE